MINNNIFNVIQLNVLLSLAYFQFRTNELLLLSTKLAEQQNVQLQMELLRQQQKTELLLLNIDSMSTKIDVLTSSSNTNSIYLNWTILACGLSILFLLLVRRDENITQNFSELLRDNTDEVLKNQGVDILTQATITSDSFKHLSLKTDMGIIDTLIQGAIG